MNLLIVNDEDLTAETMKTDICWEQYGVDEVFTAYDAEQAKEVMENQTVDLMLCDIEMPGDSGIELLAWVRESGLPVECIFLTCHPDFEYAKAAIQLDCQDYIVLPAKYEDIGAGVLKVVRRIEKSREDRKYQEYGRIALAKQVDEKAKEYGEKMSPQEMAEAVEKYVSDNISSETLSVNELAKHLFVHPVYLNRIFKKERNMTVGAYITDAKMKMAGELLKSGKFTVTAVAEMVGYQGYSNFNSNFKKYYGCNPKEYAAGHKNGA